MTWCRVSITLPTDLQDGGVDDLYGMSYNNATIDALAGYMPMRDAASTMRQHRGRGRSVFGKLGHQNLGPLVT